MDALFISLSNNVSFWGKTWWVFMVLMRLSTLLFSGLTLFYDEQDRFVCNTIQPGCTNVCLDIFAPLSLLHFWLLQLLTLSFPHLVFLTFITHKVLSSQRTRSPSCSSGRSQTSSLSTSSRSSNGTSMSKAPLQILPGDWSTATFPCAYILDLVVRILLEAAFIAGQFYLYGFSVPHSFLCYEAPCVSGVACYTSRPTEKTWMLTFMLSVASMSLLLSLVDLVGSLRSVGRKRRKREMMLKEEELSKGEQSSVFMGNEVSEDMEVILTKDIPNGVLEKEINDSPAPSNAPSHGLLPHAPRINPETLASVLTIRGKGHALGEAGVAVPCLPTFAGTLGHSRYVLHSHYLRAPASSPEAGRAAPAPGFTLTPAGSRRVGQYASMAGKGSEQGSDCSETQDRRAYV